MKKPLQFLIIFLLLIFSLNSCKKSDGGVNGGSQGTEIIVGEVGSMTGSEATFGTSTHQGIELALKEINSKGGIKGKNLRLVSLDDQGKADEAATAITRLITQDKVVAVLGEVASSRSLAMAGIAQPRKVPMISPSSTNPKVTQQGDYIFRVCFIDPFQGQVMAKFAINNLGLKKVAVLRDLKSDYSIGLSDFFIAEFKKLGGEIVGEQTYSGGDTDYKAQLTSLRSKGAEALFIPGYYTDVALIARQASDIGLKLPLLGGDGWDSPKLIEIGGESLENSYFSTHYSPEDTSPQIQDFIKRYKESYGLIPDGLAAMGYDAALVLADSLNRAKSLTTADLRDAIAATKDFQGVTGKISIDDKRNAVKAAVVLKIVNGQQKFAASINP
jgi:branched-chain amino acid transport system substrate-binding protein